MTWKELLLSKVGNYVLLTTATTGLKPSLGACLLAVSYMLPGDDDVHTVIQAVDHEKAMQTAEYHRIGSELLQTRGLLHEAFTERLHRLLDHKTVITYNPDFQARFLQEYVPDLTYVNLPQVWKAANMFRIWKDKELGELVHILKSIDTVAGKAPAVKYICTQLNMVYETPLSQLPCEYNVQIVNSILESLGSIEAAIC